MDTDVFSIDFFDAAREAAPDLLGRIGPSARHADLFCEQSLKETARFRVSGGHIRKDIHRHRNEGYAVQVIGGERDGHAWADGASLVGANDLAEEARLGASVGVVAKSVELRPATGNDDGQPPAETPDGALTETARQAVNSAQVQLLGNLRIEATVQILTIRRLIIGHDGFQGDRRERYFNLRLETRDQDGNVAYGVVGRTGIDPGQTGADPGQTGTEPDRELEGCPEGLVRTLDRQLRAFSESRRPPTGVLPVVLSAGWGGVWLHEVIGHLLEADNEPLRGTAGISVGSRIADLNLRLVDDPTLPTGRGSFSFDDEGNVAEKTTLIEEGVLQTLISDRRTARAMELDGSGNGRRQNHRFPPLPRMTNLILDAGSATADDLIAEAGRGIYVSAIKGGVLDPRRGTYTITVLCGSAIENGRLTYPVTDLVLRGRLDEALLSIRGVADDFRLDAGRGWCEKRGQIVPVSIGMPSILLDSVMVSERSLRKSDSP